MDGVWIFLSDVLRAYAAKMVSFQQTMAIPTLLSALILAALIVLLRRKPGRNTRLRVLLRALFPKRITRHASARLDLAYYLANNFLFVWFIVYVVVTQGAMATFCQHLLNLGFGVPSAVLPEWLYTGVMVLLLFVAYEFAYWLDHYLSHRLPFLWEFHKVHHSAEVLTPLTNSRVHFFDTALFFNTMGIVMGVVQALVNYGFGRGIDHGAWAAGYTPLLLVFYYLWGHLQHSELWVTFPDRLNHVFLSPAHHQIHHSNAVEHYDRNFGHCLAVWDWMFGTLYTPSKRKAALRFGVDENAHLKRFVPSTFMPCVYSLRVVGRMMQQRCRRMHKQVVQMHDKADAIRSEAR